MIIMNRTQKIIAAFLLLTTVVSIGFVISLNFNTPQGGINTNFPDFITKNEDYFITRIGAVPTVDRDSYHLDITGLIENPRSYNLDELQSLNLTELTLTYECIGNGVNGNDANRSSGASSARASFGGRTAKNIDRAGYYSEA